MSSDPTVFISAGEPSGDLYGGRLAAELRRRLPGAKLLGLGGARMEAAGVERLAGLDRLAVMGVAELAGHLPFFLRLRRRVRETVAREGVDLLVAVDYPGFNLPLVRFASRRGAAVLYYAPPQVWAWRRGRARRVADRADVVCTVLPFAAEPFARAGAEVEFVGHPLLDEMEREPEGRGRPGGQGASGDRSPLLGLFPGSREQEVRRLLPRMVRAARRLQGRRADLEVAVARAPEVPDRAYALPAGVPELPPRRVAREATAALAASGTVTLELAMHATPMAVAYRMHPVTFALARRLVSVEHVSLVNLVHGARLVPELLQERATPERMADAVDPLLSPGRERRRVVEGLADVRSRLGRRGVARRVADRCVGLLDRGRRAA